jgi:hypothetical protein
VYAFGIGPLVQLFIRITPKKVLAHSGWASVTAGSDLGVESRARRNRTRRNRLRERRVDAADVEDVVGQHAGQTDRPCTVT